MVAIVWFPPAAISLTTLDAKAFEGNEGGPIPFV
jgi:hypothetical protein